MDAILDKFSKWDKTITTKIAAKSPKRMKLASFFAISGNAIPWFIVAFLFFIFDLFMSRNVNLLQMFLAAACGLTTSSIKFLIRRQRPDEELAKQYAVDIDNWSFPSGHAGRMFSLAITLTLFYPRVGWVFLIWAIAVCYGRIALQIHWFLDIVGGALIGSIWAVIGYVLREKFFVLFTPISEWFPQILQ
ncbi:MAG: phosphatase PAP2 family protein [Candidatus Heimdallarchaeota archaeon]|nr:phosphatase PAP2 family protein [Candidatus Heimdallarchaeota archaeon]MCK4878535.1 phosphatase PAP2 family protein [Candidatus Heimdallarchaeota archaeon]